MEKSDTEKRIQKIIKDWFITDSLLFSAVTTHHTVLNDSLSVPMRTGNLCIEYSNVPTENLSDDELSDLLKIEVYRILFKHPYTRQPHKANPTALLLASDIVISKFFIPSSKIESAGVIFLNPAKTLSISSPTFTSTLIFSPLHKNFKLQLTFY